MSREIISILLLIIFTAELAVMEMLSPLFIHQHPVAAGLLDATLLTLLLAPPLWLLCFPHANSIARKSLTMFTKDGRPGLFCKILATTFCAEFLLMLLLPGILTPGYMKILPLLDAALTMLIVLPMLRWQLSKYNQQPHKLLLTDFLGTPVMVYFTLLYMVFLVDMILEVMQPYLVPQGLTSYYMLFDSVLTTCLIAPFFWAIVSRPLTKAANINQTKTRTILEQLADAVISLDGRGRIREMNAAAKEIFGFSSEKFVGQSANLLFVENQLNIETLIARRDDKQNCVGELIQREVACINHLGHSLFAEATLTCIQGHDQKEWLLILHDITQYKDAQKALKESNERFRQIFEQSDDAIAFFKPQTCQIIDCNTTFCKLFNYAKADLPGREFAELVDKEGYQRVKWAILETASGIPAQLSDCLGLRRTGATFNLSMRSKLMTINDVNIVVCSFRDISGRIRLEREAKEIQSRLIQANKMTSLGLMVSGVAHEINNPNNFIMANSRMLANSWPDISKVLYEYQRDHGDFCLGGIPMQELDQHAPKLLAGIQDGSNRINAIVTKLKNFYRHDQSSEPPIDINQVARSAASLLQHELINYTNNFELKLAPQIPTLRGNSQQLSQVVINLLMNACQALPDKAHGITLTTGCNPQNNEIILTVSDDGRGMSHEDSKKIMDPFFTTKLDSGGTGLGLSICKSILTEHQGILEFTSEAGKGSTFTVRLPTDQPVAKD